MPPRIVPTLAPHGGKNQPPATPTGDARTPGKPSTPATASDPGRESRDRLAAGGVGGTAAGQASRDRRAAGGTGGIVGEVAELIGRYVVMPDDAQTVTAAWVVSAWMMDCWDRFPNLAVTSPEKRCGKTRLLQLLELVLPNARSVANVSPAAVYRLIEAERPSLLIDEAQSLVRRGSENTEVLRELLCSGIDRNAKVVRCGGANRDEIHEFSVYAAKVIALIGEPDGVVADRCLPVRMRRMTGDDRAERYVSRVVEPVGRAVRDKVEAWAAGHKDRVQAVYDGLEPFDIENDRLAELLLPLMAVAEVDGGGHLDTIRGFADALDGQDAEAEKSSPGVKLLAALRELFAVKRKGDGLFLSTSQLLIELKGRTEEPWLTFTRGQPITAEAMANLLKPYGISSVRNEKQTARGYVLSDFRDAWNRYLPTPSEKAV